MADELYLLVWSFAEFSHARAIGVGASFDAHPAVRPMKVGGDVARIPVGESMAALIERSGLPIEWQTERGRRGQLGSGDTTRRLAHPHLVVEHAEHVTALVAVHTAGEHVDPLRRDKRDPWRCVHQESVRLGPFLIRDSE